MSMILMDREKDRLCPGRPEGHLFVNGTLVRGSGGAYERRTPGAVTCVICHAKGHVCEPPPSELLPVRGAEVCPQCWGILDDRLAAELRRLPCRCPQNEGHACC